MRCSALRIPGIACHYSLLSTMQVRQFLKKSMDRVLQLLIALVLFSLTISGVAFAGGTCANFSAGACPASIPAGVNSFYFIDYLSGSDSNNGTSEATPWQHAPSMANATGNPAAHTPTAGEGWIFKGGVTVDYHAFPMNVPWNGTATNPTYIGIDQNWYAGASWTRPVFDGGGSTGYSPSTQGLIGDHAHQTNSVVIDDLEFKGLYWPSGGGGNFWAFCYVCANSIYNETNWEVKNVYVHGWTAAGGSSGYDPAGSSQSLISLTAANGNLSGLNSIHDSVFDGSDSSQNCCMASLAPIQYNNYYSYLVQAPFNGGLTSSGLILFHDNYSTHNVITANGTYPHGNCFHVFAWNGTGAGGNVIAYNNVLDCKYAGTFTMGMAFELTGPNANVYAFNNILILGSPYGFSDSSWSPTGAGTTFLEFNNTVQAYDASAISTSACLTTSYNNVLTAADNFCITNNGSMNSVYEGWTPFNATLNFPSPTFTITCSGSAQTNLGMRQICAPIGSGNGTGNLNFTETYPFAPMDATAAATVGTGANHSSYCTTISAINSAAGTACLSDTTAGVGYETTNHTVIWPNRKPIARPTSAGWQVGAYEFPANAPAAPTGLSAIVN